MVNFLVVIIEHFRYILWLRRYKQKSVEVGVFRRGWTVDHFERKFQTECRVAHAPTTVAIRKLE